MTTPQKRTNSATSVHALNTRLGVHSLQDLHAGVVVAAELFTKMGTALSLMAKATSPLLKVITTTLAEERYWSNFDTNYWLIRDDSPMFAQRVRGYRGDPDPMCFNCEHSLTDHEVNTMQMPAGQFNEIRQDGGKIKCLINRCSCYYFEPSYVVDDAKSYAFD